MSSMGSDMGERSDRDDRGAASDARDARFDYNGGRIVPGGKSARRNSLKFALAAMRP